ncbi:MAG: putative toxin-antitoxin system toxin component, PIN family [Candidatus Aminicenantes bacterium RBG_16_63_16]|nr:MAG: putative toxin-antitoxin system toxin component, PIN family [Candidatus Aminicenantes bacterium RBG_16_63_16]
MVFGGPPEILMQAVRARRIALFTSPQILAELASILGSKFRWTEEDIREAVLAIGRHAELVKPDLKISVLEDDGDNRILECAVEANADYIVSGDHHLLALKNFRRIKILRASDLAAKLR